MIRREPVLVSTPRLIPQEDFLTILDAVLRIVVLAWIQIRRARLLTNDHCTQETRTAGLLYQEMLRVERERKPHLPRVKVKTEVGTYSSDAQEVPDGRIDIEVVYSLGDDPDLRLECKRVSATPADDPARLARKYVAEGILRFVSDKYGRGHRWGVLVAFVIDGFFEPTVEIVSEKVSTYHNDPRHLTSPWQAEDRFVPRRHLFSTEHWQGGGPRKIRLLHLFLPFPRRED